MNKGNMCDFQGNEIIVSDSVMTDMSLAICGDPQNVQHQA